MSERPSKRWFNTCLDFMQTKKGYSLEKSKAMCGSLWYIERITWMPDNWTKTRLNALLEPEQAFKWLWERIRAFMRREFGE